MLGVAWDICGVSRDVDCDLAAGVCKITQFEDLLNTDSFGIPFHQVLKDNLQSDYHVPNYQNSTSHYI